MEHTSSIRRLPFLLARAWVHILSGTPVLRNRAAVLLPGIALCAVIALIGTAIGGAPVLAGTGISSLIVAMTLDMALGNTVMRELPMQCAEGVHFTKQHLLRLGIILYGVRLTFQDIAQVGAGGVAVDAMVVVTTFGLALLFGRRLLKIDEPIVLLVGAGSSICGAAAVLATNAVVKGKSDDTTVAIATVVIFGTIATFLYPVLYRLEFISEWIAASPAAFGIYAGSTIHEVAQVVATAQAIDANAVDAAVIAKMVRVIMLCPFLFLLAIYLAVRTRRPERQSSAGLAASVGDAVPWFAVWFVAVIGVNSLGVVPAVAIPLIHQVDSLLLVIAMAALGLGTRFSAFSQAGVRPLVLGALLFAWLAIGGGLINYVVADVFR